MQEATSVDCAVVRRREIFKFPGDNTKSVASFLQLLKQQLPNSITCDVSQVNLYKAATGYDEWRSNSDAQVRALLVKPARLTRQVQQIYLTQETEMTPRPLSDYLMDGALQVFILLPRLDDFENEENDEETSAREFEWTAVTRQQQL